MRAMNSAILAGALLATAPMMAQGRFSASGSVVGAMDSLKKVTNQDLGLSLGVGYESVIESARLPWRVSVNGHYFGGKKQDDGLTSKLSSVQVAGDVFVATPIESLRFFTGLTVNKYFLSNSGTTRDTNGDLVAMWPVDTAKGLKLGARAGFEMEFTKHLSGEVMVQFTELGSTPNVVRDEGATGLGQGGINPSWIEIGVRYNF